MLLVEGITGPDASNIGLDRIVEMATEFIDGTDGTDGTEGRLQRLSGEIGWFGVEVQVSAACATW